MKRKDLSMLVVVGFISAVVSFILANLLFKAPISQSSQVPDVPTISASFPDIYNDPVYSQFLNRQAFDPTQPVNTGGSKNRHPFNGSQ